MFFLFLSFILYFYTRLYNDGNYDPAVGDPEDDDEADSGACDSTK